MSTLTPLNDFFRTIYFEEVDGVTFAATPVTTGTVTAFLATSNEPTAIAADPSLSVNAVPVGVASPGPGQYPLGTWGLVIDASVLTPTLLDQLFTSNTPYLIVVRAGGVRVFEKLKYVRARAADQG